MREPEIGFVSERRLDLALPGGDVALFQTQGAERVARRSHRWLQCQRAPQLTFGFVQPALVDEHLRRLLVGCRISGIERQKALVCDKRIIVATDRTIDIRHVEDGQVVVRLERQCPLKALQRARELAATSVFVPHHDPCVDHLRVFRQDLAQRFQTAFRIVLVVEPFSCGDDEIE